MHLNTLCSCRRLRGLTEQGKMDPQLRIVQANAAQDVEVFRRDPLRTVKHPELSGMGLCLGFFALRRRQQTIEPLQQSKEIPLLEDTSHPRRCECFGLRLQRPDRFVEHRSIGTPPVRQRRRCPQPGRRLFSKQWQHRCLGHRKVGNSVAHSISQHHSKAVIVPAFGYQEVHLQPAARSRPTPAKVQRCKGRVVLNCPD